MEVITNQIFLYFCTNNDIYIREAYYSKEVEYEEVVYDSPKNILSDIKALEDEVQQGLRELEGML